MADVDGDGDVDLIVGPSSRPTALLTNLHTQAQAQAEAPIGSATALAAFLNPGQLKAPEIFQPLISTTRLRRNLQIPGFGQLAIDPSQAIALQALWISAPRGVSAATLTVPNQASLRGTTLYFQGLFIPRLRLSNPTRLTIR